MLEVADNRQGAMEFMDAGSQESLLRRIRSEFYEMPGMCLTVTQASRLWNMDRQTAEMALHLLVERGFLTRTDDGRFMAAQWTTFPTA